MKGLKQLLKEFRAVDTQTKIFSLVILGGVLMGIMFVFLMFYEGYLDAKKKEEILMSIRERDSKTVHQNQLRAEEKEEENVSTSSYESSNSSITVEGEATESEINMGEYLKEEFMGDYDITFLADDKIFALMPATRLELETIEMTIADRDTFAWDGFTSLMDTYSSEVASTLGSQYQVALVSNIYGESILLYRVKNGQGNYDYMKN
ncbi:MAG TPA: hypothetical protein DEB42_00435 [Jeotgalicoccus sp.]|nr:hypothetical protein [Jeotgalicoccus sp.]